MGAQLVFTKSMNDLLHSALGQDEEGSIATLDRLLSAAADEKQSISFLLCSIDSFVELSQRKPDALKKAASGLLGVLTEQTPNDTYVDCTGVNEFLLVVPGIDRERSLQFSGELQRRFNAMANAIRTRPKIEITMSIAAGTFPDDASHRIQLMRGLREAMYQSQLKDAGKVAFIVPPSYEPCEIDLTSIQLEQVEQLVKQEGRSFHSIIREAVDDVISKHSIKALGP